MFFALRNHTKEISCFSFMFEPSQALLDEAAGLGWDLAATKSETFFIYLSNLLKHHCCSRTQVLVFTFC